MSLRSRIAAFVALALLVVGCSGSPSQSSSGPAAAPAPQPAGKTQKTFRLGVVLKTLQSEYFVNMKNGAEQAAKDFGVEVIVQAPETATDVEGQTRIVENMIQQKSVDALIITPINSDAFGAVVADAKAAGIPVFAADTRLNSPDVLSFIGVDNKSLAQTVAQYVADFVKAQMGGKATMVVLEGTAGAQSSVLRNEGYSAVFGKEKDIQILASTPGNYQRAKGNQVAEDLITRFPKVQIILAANDEMALGAVQAAEARKLNLGKDAYIVGFNGQSEVVKAIQSGKMLASVYANEFGMAHKAVEVVAAYLKDGTKPPAEVIGHTGFVVDAKNAGSFDRNQKFQ